MNLRPARYLASLVAAASMAVAMNASAGALALRDDAHVLTPADGDALTQVVAKAPFDARLVTTTAYADQAALSRFVGSLVAEADMVVVGIDPTHRHVQVHFGTQSHIPEAAWPSIERAGNDAFKRGAWEEGAAAIFQSAEQSVSALGSPSPAASPHSTGGGFIGPLVWLLVAGVVIAAIVMFVRRRAQGYGGGGYGGQAPYGGGPSYGPGNQPGGMGALGGGILGAGLGGIAGYELGKMEGEREHDRDGGGGFDGGGSSGSSDGGSFDAGGGGSSWGDSGSSDGGGGGFDGGGGGDSGGGSDF